MYTGLQYKRGKRKEKKEGEKKDASKMDSQVQRSGLSKKPCCSRMQKEKDMGRPFFCHVMKYSRFFYLLGRGLTTKGFGDLRVLPPFARTPQGDRGSLLPLDFPLPPP